MALVLLLTSRQLLTFHKVIILLAWLDSLDSDGSRVLGQGTICWVAKLCQVGSLGMLKMCRSFSDAWQQDSPGLSCSRGHRICYKIGVWLGGLSYAGLKVIYLLLEREKMLNVI